MEFNTFPSSKSKSHGNHKLECGHATALRLSAIYGANGAGKSNLLEAISFLATLIKTESLSKMTFGNDIAFAFDSDTRTKPSELAIEFFNKSNIFYYHIAFDQQQVFAEELLLSKKTTDKEIFVRTADGISIGHEFAGEGVNTVFVNALTKLVRKDMLLLPFLATYYPEAVAACKDAYDWFAEKLEVVRPDVRSWTIPHTLDTDAQFRDMVNALIPELGTGVYRLSVKKELILEEDMKQDLKLSQMAKKAKAAPGVPLTMHNEGTNDIANIVYEDGCVYRKTLCSEHKGLDGSLVEIPLACESDGTRRLIEYMPMLFDVLNRGKVYVVDEIERSMHPIMTRDLVQKLSESDSAKGQLIFTTHESSLLDQDIFRPDEIWFAQKDVEQATQLYPLSDFNIHKTANIENGYLNGRYGGIPFLSNLKDLHW